jgi:hypothetical protein
MVLLAEESMCESPSSLSGTLSEVTLPVSGSPCTGPGSPGTLVRLDPDVEPRILEDEKICDMRVRVCVRDPEMDRRDIERVS